MCGHDEITPLWSAHWCYLHGVHCDVSVLGTLVPLLATAGLGSFPH
jgi:hypothetical protein